jgi:hypothetical protein
MRYLLIFNLFLFFLTTGFSAMAQDRMSNEAYIERFKDISMEKMREYKIPASITLAQGILESGSGNSNLAKNANNHFGIKCHGWKGRTFYMDDDEKNECFRAYRKPEESYHDHSLFLTSRPRYSSLFQLDIMDYKAWSHGLSKAGYATNPRYPELLIRIIERNELYLYDQLAMGKKQIAKAKSTLGETHVFVPPSPESFEVIENTDKGRTIYTNNDRKLIFARQDDSFASLAEEFSIFSWQIVKYNELDKSDELVEGQMLYLQKKRRRSRTYESHTVSVGETMYGISQLYGIRLKVLQRKNNLPEGVQPMAGTTIKLK